MPTELIPYLKTSSLCVLVAILLSACSPSDPKVTYFGIDAGGAISILDSATTQEQSEIAIQKIEKERRIGFDWVYFWTEIGKNNRFLRLNGGHQSRVLELSSESCSIEGFRHFAETVLTVETGFDFVFGSKRRCAQPLNSELFLKYIAYFRGQNLGLADSRVAELMLSEYRLSGSLDRAKMLDSLNVNEWEKLFQSLLKSGEGQTAAQLVQAHQDQFGGLRFVGDMAARWLEKPDSFEPVVQKNSLIDVLHILTADDRLSLLTGKVGAKNWWRVFNAIEVKFKTEATTFKYNPAVYSRLLRTIAMLQQLPLRAEHAPPFADQLQWFERILRDFETGLIGLNQALPALDGSDMDLTAIWLKLRLKHQLTKADREQVARINTSTPLAESLKWKLQVHSATTEFAHSRAQTEYCHWLRDNGVKPRLIDGSTFEWSATAQPGCITLTGNQNPTDTIAKSLDESVNMAFDSVLITSGWNLKLTAPAFDGSMLDLSQKLKWPDLSPEPAPAGDEALAVPLLVGIEMQQDNAVNGPGVYFFVYHHTVRTATTGRPADTQASNGFPGGSLDVEVRSLDLSFMPAVLSAGGAGQKAVPPRPGGAESVSTVEWISMAQELDAMPKNAIENIGKPIPLYGPTYRVLDDLFTRGTKTEKGTLKLFTDPGRLLKHLNPDQIASGRKLCPADENEISCWEAVLEQAKLPLWNLYSSACPRQGDGPRVCAENLLGTVNPRLNSLSYIEPAAAPGPVNPDGKRGVSGQSQMKEIQ